MNVEDVVRDGREAGDGGVRGRDGFAERRSPPSRKGVHVEVRVGRVSPLRLLVCAKEDVLEIGRD